MKRIFLLMLIIFICMGGCYKHNFEHDLTIKAPEQCAMNKSPGECSTVGESLEMKRAEFVQKMQELKIIVNKQRPVQQRMDSIIVVFPARPIDGTIE